MAKRDAEFIFSFIWPLPAKVSFPHLQNVFASRTYFAYVSYYYIPSFPVTVILIVIWVVVSLCYSVLKQRELLPVQGKKELSK